MLEEISKGGFSTVYRPSSLKEGQQSYVIKRPNPRATKEEKTRTMKKYKRQKALLDFLHENNPAKSKLFNQIYSLQQGQGIRMKDLGDTDLRRIYENHYERLSRDLDHVVPQLMDAFLTLFRTGIVHRDIKMQNIMARHQRGHFQISFVDFTDSLTKKEINEVLDKFKVAGTAPFMSPELLNRIWGTKRDMRKGTYQEYVANDLWSLGVVLYMLIYHEHPLVRIKRLHPFLYSNYPSPTKLYNRIRDSKMLREKITEELFPTVDLPETHKKYVPDVTALLSFDPNVRLYWLSQQFRKERQQNAVKQRNDRIDMLLQAATMLQQKQKRQRTKTQL